MMGQLNIAKTNKFDTITLAQLKRLSFTYNIHTKFGRFGTYFGNHHNLPGNYAA